MAMRGFEKRSDELRRARQQMANLVSSGQVFAMDRMGTPVQRGDLVLTHLTPDPIMQIVDIKPPLTAHDPPDSITLVCALQIPIRVRAGLPLSNMLVIGHVQEESEQKPADEAPPTPTEEPPSGEEPAKLVYLE